MFLGKSEINKDLIHYKKYREKYFPEKTLANCSVKRVSSWLSFFLKRYLFSVFACKHLPFISDYPKPIEAQCLYTTFQGASIRLQAHRPPMV